MRPEFDGEIDSVLRGHARRGGALPVAWEGGLRPSISTEAASGSHLDADELAAFGEGALPAAARARYSAHLADCDDCRRSVTQVALAAGVADRIEERERGGVAVAAVASAATQSPSWRERVSAVFAPRAWRYAMPVIALVAVSAVVLVVTRNVPREGSMETARSRGSEARQTSAPAANDSHHAEATQPQQQQSAQEGTQTSNTGPTGIVGATGEDADTSAAGELAKLRPKGVGQPTVGGGSVVTADAQPTVARPVQAEPPPPATSQDYAVVTTPTPLPPAAAPAPRQMVLRDVVPQPTPAPVREHAEVTASERTRDDSRATSLPRDEAPATKRHGPQRGLGGRAGALSSAAGASKDDRAAAARRARGPQKNNEANSNEPEEAKAKREEDREQQQRAETRSVGGRRFRREGGVWIDTAYSRGQATVVVRRDSEQYRALVADEPEIGRISRALGGEAVIVWKGRAYRVKP